MSLAISINLLGVIIWVGGMFFTHMILRRVTNRLLEPHERLPLLLGVFDAFFPWVWLSVFLILASGYWMLFTHYGDQNAFWLSFMTGGGTLMAAIFVFIYVLPYHQLGAALNTHDMPKAVAAISLIRQLIVVNLALGLAIALFTPLGKHGLF